MKKQQMDSGVSFCVALRRKYSPECMKSTFENIQLSSNFKLTSKLQNHSLRKYLALDGCSINSCGDEGEIKSTCPLLQELDLSSNKFSQWEEVFKIIEDLEHLIFLNIASNPLHSARWPVGTSQYGNQRNLRHLVLNGTKVGFETVYRLLELYPSIEELHLSLNNYDVVPHTDQQFCNVHSLYLARNNFTNVGDIERVGKIFSTLKVLIICDNAITDVPDYSHFLSLEKLSLTNTNICDWECIDKLQTYPVLQDLRVVNIPLLKSFKNEKDGRYLLISRLPNIKKLNGGQVDENDREDAERLFIRHCLDLNEKPDRYHQLVAVHGELEPLRDIDLGKVHMLRLVVLGEGIGPAKLTVDSFMTAAEFKKMIGKKFSLRLSKFRLFLKYDKYFSELQATRKTLRMHHLLDDDEVILQRLDDVCGLQG